MPSEKVLQKTMELIELCKKERLIGFSAKNGNYYIQFGFDEVD